MIDRRHPRRKRRPMCPRVLPRIVHEKLSEVSPGHAFRTHRVNLPRLQPQPHGMPLPHDRPTASSSETPSHVAAGATADRPRKAFGSFSRPRFRNAPRESSAAAAAATSDAATDRGPEGVLGEKPAPADSSPIGPAIARLAQARQALKASFSFTRSRFLPMKTRVLARGSPAAHSRSNCASNSMCTPWKTSRLFEPFTASTPFIR